MTGTASATFASATGFRTVVRLPACVGQAADCGAPFDLLGRSNDCRRSFRLPVGY